MTHSFGGIGSGGSKMVRAYSKQTHPVEVDRFKIFLKGSRICPKCGMSGIEIDDMGAYCEWCDWTGSAADLEAD